MIVRHGSITHLPLRSLQAITDVHMHKVKAWALCILMSLPYNICAMHMAQEQPHKTSSEFYVEDKTSKGTRLEHVLLS